ncbi:hypothetical protein M271_01960 [Streptomyces rapamycinicus NRRL 5491]|nr:hypothetical protein M271_01960 [Streptomyces rapamycinicus NRRL 5491]
MAVFAQAMTTDTPSSTDADAQCQCSRLSA